MRRWLEARRTEKGYSKAALARAVKISPPSYWQIEHGKTNPTPTTAKKIAEVLGFDWTKFYE